MKAGIIHDIEQRLPIGLQQSLAPPFDKAIRFACIGNIGGGYREFPGQPPTTGEKYHNKPYKPSDCQVIAVNTLDGNIAIRGFIGLNGSVWEASGPSVGMVDGS